MAYKMGLLIALVAFLCVTGGSDGMRPRDEEYLKSNPDASVYFLREDLYEGAKFTMVPLSAPGYVVPVTRRHVGDSLPVALKLLGAAEGSLTEWGLKHHTEKCQKSASEGKKTFCANSMESLVEQVTSRLGPRFSVFETKYISQHNGDGNESMQEYTVTAIPFRRKIHSRSIACHQVDVVYLCHDNHGPELFNGFLEGEDGTTLDALIACHENTTDWEPEHVAFEPLKVKPGDQTICHFFGVNHFVWVAEE